MSGAARIRDRAEPYDLLSDAVSIVRSRLRRGNSAGDRLRTLWAGATAAGDLGAPDVVENEFLQLARDAGLVIEDPAHGLFGEKTVKHVIRWAMLGMNPFQ